MIAAYPIAVEGWGKDDAIAEMTQGPYGFSSNGAGLIPFVAQLDVEELKGKLSRRGS